MIILDDFSQWMKNNSNLSESSVYKYTRALNTISNEMLEQRIINKRLLNMNIVELDIAINNIFNNMFFIEKNTRGDKMYSNALKQYRFFMQERSEDYSTEQSIENEILNSKILGTTEKQVIINARVGQGKYRESLIKKYDHKCIVTGIDKLNLLIASHIKPWRVCNNNERIDTENGLLLSANMDSNIISYQTRWQYAGDKNGGPCKFIILTFFLSPVLHNECDAEFYISEQYAEYSRF